MDMDAATVHTKRRPRGSVTVRTKYFAWSKKREKFKFGNNGGGDYTLLCVLGTGRVHIAKTINDP